MLSGWTRCSSNRLSLISRSFHGGLVCNASLGIDNTVEHNKKTESNRLEKTLSKFWEKVGVEHSTKDSKLLTQLDSKTIKTPLGNLLAVDKNRALLAHLLKNEWKNLSSLSIKNYSLPLTSLVSRCIDLEKVNVTGDRESMAKTNGDRSKIVNDLLNYLDTDTLLVFSPKQEFEGALRAEQDKLYLPIIDEVTKFLSKYSDTPLNLQILDSDLHGLRGNRQNEATKLAATKYLNSLTHWDFAIFERMVLTTKSFICGILLLQNKTALASKECSQHTTDDIIRLATLEVLFQIERWGEVEDTHDVDKRDIKRLVNAAAIVAYVPTQE